MANPLLTTTLTTLSYTTLYALSTHLQTPTSDAPANLKAISSLHATVTTGLALYALSRPWTVKQPLAPLNLGLGKSSFNDSVNPLIAGRSALGNAITGLETGYLLFDTLALVYTTSRPSRARERPVGPTSAVTLLAKQDPLTLTHHLSLLLGLGTLQHFIAHSRERGVYIILTFLLMNASTPLLHLRWWQRRESRMGRASVAMDALLAVVFAVARGGSVVWVLREYGRWHGLGAGVGAVWEALRGQRWVCQVGTGALLGLNGVWWGLLVRGIVRRVLRGK